MATRTPSAWVLAALAGLVSWIRWTAPVIWMVPSNGATQRRTASISG
jgi:hypothetical protein